MAGTVYGALGVLLGPWVLRLDELANSIVYGPRSYGLSGIDGATTLGITLLAATASAAFVARRADGRSALLLYDVLVAATAAGIVLAAVEYTRRSLAEPHLSGRTALGEPLGATLAVAPALIVLVAALVHRRPGSDGQRTDANGLLEAAGGYAIAGMAALVVLVPAARAALLLSPYWLAGLGTVPHIAVVVLQTLVAATIVAARAPLASAWSVLALFLVLPLATLLPSELEPLTRVALFRHDYVPLSLLTVPALAALGGSLAWALRLLRPGTRPVVDR